MVILHLVSELFSIITWSVILNEHAGLLWDYFRLDIRFLFRWPTQHMGETKRKTGEGEEIAPRIIFLLFTMDR